MSITDYRLLEGNSPERPLTKLEVIEGTSIHLETYEEVPKEAHQGLCALCCGLMFGKSAGEDLYRTKSGQAMQRLPIAEESVVAHRFERANFRVGLAEMNGWRNAMEDAHVVFLQDSWGFFGILDGHGGPPLTLILPPNSFSLRPKRYALPCTLYSILHKTYNLSTTLYFPMRIPLHLPTTP